MKNAAWSTAVQTSLFLFLFSITATLQAEHSNDDELHIATAPARMILDHNKWLLTGSTIGDALSKSSNSKARGLYEEAHRLFRKAELSLNSGEESQARIHAVRSIQFLYESDRHHYELAFK